MTSKTKLLAATTFLVIVGALMSILFIIEVKINMLIQWLCMSSAKYVD